MEDPLTRRSVRGGADATASQTDGDERRSQSRRRFALPVGVLNAGRGDRLGFLKIPTPCSGSAHEPPKYS